MAASNDVEYEAAKFLQKLIHESTDEPAKLATKLYVILQHMKASGKENSMPYQVISKAMETVINQHGLDIEALMSSRVPLSTGSHSGEGTRAQAAGCSQPVGAFTDSKSGMTENDTSRVDGFAPGRPPAAPGSMGHDLFQGCTTQRSTRSFDQESPSSMDTRSTNSHSQDRRETAGLEQQGSERDPKRGSIKRKRSDTSAIEPQIDSSQQPDAHTGVPDMRRERLIDKGKLSGTFPGPPIDPKAGKGPPDSEYWKQGFIKGAGSNFQERVMPGQMVSPNQGDVATTNANSASLSDAAGVLHMPMNVDRFLQGGNPSNVGDMGMLRSAASRDMGKSPVIQTSVTSMPFKEHHLKQLRAQCLVFLAFRNGLPPKRLHLEIALGNISPKEGSSGIVDAAQNELMSDKGKQQTTVEASSATEVTSLQRNITKTERGSGSSLPARSVTDADSILRETENLKVMEMKPGPSDASLVGEEKIHLSGRGIMEADWPSQAGGANHFSSASGVNMQLKPEMLRWTGVAHNDPSRSVLPVSMQHDLGNRKESSSLPQHDSGTMIQQHADNSLSTSWKAVNGMDSDYHRQVAANDANLLLRTTSHDDSSLDTRRRSISDVSNIIPAGETIYMHTSLSPIGSVDKSSEVEEEDNGFAPSAKYTMSEQWIMAHHKRKLASEQKWMQKVQKADERIVARFSELKETVSSSEDISARTRSVIELKKLQLLELQRRLRSNILNDFFKPVQKEMDQLKAIKKHRIGRRLKHVEKYEQKMKEERQKKIRERQKEFFSEVEIHRERLEEMFKFKRERCKSFNRYVKEFHKKKERIHREQNDKIQREKINLLKINDVEGYLRMVQDAKSDRVKQLLKETEKYLLKLGSKLKKAKPGARQVDIDESGSAGVDDSAEVAVETEDESDQAKHYLESNEKYYLIAHSIKENIAEQPSGLIGGKLREYQMNGLRWLLSLYNNHLNGILADEMGLGKTVQVISLLCHLMEVKNDRGPFLVVVPSSVLPGWEQELSFWAPGINKIVYSGTPDDRRRLFKEIIIHQKFNVLLTTYEYLMNKHDRPKLSKIHWHYVIIDEGHRIKNASCKLNAELKHYRSAHRLLLTGTPLQNNLEELWALLNFLLPNIFNSSEDFSQWFNKPFESSVDDPTDEALLSEEENLLIINRLHQVLRPFVLRRLKHKVENELPEKIERLVRCEASAYQKLLMKRVEDNLGALGVHKARSVHNSVIELRNICNHPYISHLHSEQVDNLIPKHYLPPVVRLCGKLEMLDRLLPKLKATNHRVLLFSTMTRLLDVMEEYLVWKQYRYLRLDGHTSGQDRGALIDAFNRPDSPYFIFLLSIRAGGVGVNLQAADTVIIFDTDWNPQVDLQAQARAHRIGQKKDVLVLRLETVHSVEEQVRAAAEHKLGVANQSITAGFFDNNTSAEDRREYLETLLRESKKEEAAPVLDDDGLNYILARSEPEIDVFETIDQQRREEEMATWKSLVSKQEKSSSEEMPPLPPRLLTDDDLKAFCEAMKDFEGSSAGMKRKGGYIGSLDTQVYGRGKRAREVRSYEEQWTEDEFDKMCKDGSLKEEQMDVWQPSHSSQLAIKVELPSQTPAPQALPPTLLSSPPVKRGRGRPRRAPLVDASSSPVVHSPNIALTKPEVQRVMSTSIVEIPTGPDSEGSLVVPNAVSGVGHHVDVVASPHSQAVSPLPSFDIGAQFTPSSISVTQPKQQGQNGKSNEKNIQGQSGSETPQRRGRKSSRVLSSIPSGIVFQDPKPNDQPVKQASSETGEPVVAAPSTQSNSSFAQNQGALLPESSQGSIGLVPEDSKSSDLVAPPPGGVGVQYPNPNEKSNKQTLMNTSGVPESSASPVVGNFPVVVSSESAVPGSIGLRRGRKPSEKPQTVIEPPQRRGRKKRQAASTVPEKPVAQDPNTNEQLKKTQSTVTPTTAYVAGPSSSLPGSTALAGVSGSMHHINMGFPPKVPAASQSSALVASATSDIPSESTQIPVAPSQAERRSQKSQVGEVMPLRRGRRKSTVSAGSPYVGVQNTISRQSDGKEVKIVQHKVIATRSRKMSIAQSKNVQEEAQKSDLHPVPSQSTFGSARASEHGEFPELRQVTPSNLPPITSSGVTNVIVLALESTARALNPAAMSSRTPSVLASKPDNVALKLSSAACTAILEEEMSAPPGFDIPRQSSLGGSVKKSMESVDTEISKAREEQTGSVVLGLESVTVNAEPSSVASQNKTKREESPELLTSKKTVQESEHPLKPQGSQREFESARGVTAVVQPAEEMMSPPGFDIPQQSIPETTVGVSLQCDDTQEKDISVSCEVTHCKSPEHVNKDSSKCMDSCIYHLSAVASDSGEKIKKSTDHVEEDSAPPGFATSQAPLVQDKNNKPCQGIESHIPVETVSSKSIADISMVEPKENVETCVVGIGEGQQRLRASVSKFDDEIGSINVSPVSEDVVESMQVETTGITDCIQKDSLSSEVQLENDNKSVSTSEMAEKPPEGCIDMTAPVIENPISPVSLDDKCSSESIADIPMVEPKENVEICVVGIGKDQQRLRASVSKFDDEIGSINVSPVSEDVVESMQVQTTGITVCIQKDSLSSEVQLENDNKSGSTSEMAEKPPEGGIDLTAPIIENTISPVSLDDKCSEEVGCERPTASVSSLDLVDDGEVKLSDVSVMSAENLIHPEGSAKHEDAYLENEGPDEKQADPLINETDAAASIEEISVMPESINNETIEKPQPEKPLTLGLVPEPLDDANTMLSDDTQVDDTHEAETNPLEGTDCVPSMKEKITMPASIIDETMEKTQPDKSSALGSISKPEDYMNTELQDETQTDGAHETEIITVSVVSHMRKETDICPSIGKSITVPTSANRDMVEETQPENPTASGSISGPGDIASANCVMSIECLQCPEENVKIGDVQEKDDTKCEMDTGSTRSMDNHPKENVEVGDLYPKGDVGCEMDVDSDNAVADVTATTNESTLSISAQMLLSSANSETMVVLSSESHIALGAEEKDGPGNAEEDCCAGSASLLEASEPVSVGESMREENAEGVMDDSLADSKERTEQNMEAAADDLQCSFPCVEQLDMDATPSFQNTSPAEVNADVRTSENMGVLGKQVDESRKVTEVEKTMRAPDADVEYEEAKTVQGSDHEDYSPFGVAEAVEGEAKRAPDVDVEYEKAKTAPNVDLNDCSPCLVVQAVEGEEANVPLISQHHFAEEVTREACAVNLENAQQSGGTLDDHLAAVGLDSGYYIKKSNDLVKNDSVAPEFGTTSLVQGEDDNPSKCRESLITFVSGASKDPGETCDNMQTIETAVVADVPMDKSGDKLDEDDNVVIKKDVSPIMGTGGHGKIWTEGSVTKLDDEKDSINDAAVAGEVPEPREVNNEITDIIDCGQGDCTPSEFQLFGDSTSVNNTSQFCEKPSEGVSNVMEPIIEGPSSPALVDSKTSDEFEAEKASARKFPLDPEDDVKIKHSDFSNISTEACRSPNDMAICKEEDGVSETIEKLTDDAGAAKKTITLPASTSKEPVETNQPETPPVLGSILVPVDYENTALVAQEFIKSGDACGEDNAACEMDIDLHSLMDDPIKSGDNRGKEIVEVGDACLKDAVGCEMDIDSHGPVTESTESTDSSALSTPNVSNIGSAQDFHSAGNNESVKESTESDTVLGDDGKDGDFHVTQKEFSGTIRSSLVEASGVEPVSVVKCALEDEDKETGQNVDSCSDMPERLHVGYSVPCSLKPENSDDGETRDPDSNVAEANIDESPDIPDAIHAGDNLPSTSKSDNSDDSKSNDLLPFSDAVEASQKDNSCSDVPEVVHDGDSVPCTSRVEISGDGNFGSVVAQAIEDEANVDDGSSDIPDVVHDVDSVALTPGPPTCNDEACEKDDSHSDIPEAVHAGDCAPITKPESCDHAETRNSGCDITQAMDAVKANVDDDSSGIPDSAHDGDSVIFSPKPNDLNDGISENEKPQAFHDAENVPSTSKPNNSDDDETRVSCSNVGQAKGTC